MTVLLTDLKSILTIVFAGYLVENTEIVLIEIQRQKHVEHKSVSES